MAQSTTNLGKIHVFPSETLYNQFKNLVADNDLALLKDDGAYIVAALLEQNGYVKFNNGLILQWGVLAAKNYTQPYKVDFALAFPVTCYIVITKVINATEQDDASFGDICVDTYTKSYFYARNGRQKVLPGIYVALGM